jgi:tetratricopeptide (TPR) repeat protein
VTVERRRREAAAALLNAQLDTPYTVWALLEVALYGLDRYAEALLSCKQALDIRRRALGDKHLDTAASLANLGSTLGKLGRREEALQRYQETLAIRRVVLCDRHPLKRQPRLPVWVPSCRSWGATRRHCSTSSKLCTSTNQS